jgi:iron complex transport system ATP-binding protein
MSGLIITDVSVKVNTRLILDRVGFHARSGQVTGLIGPNGAGKSTLLRSALGLVPMSAGTAVYDGRDLATLSRRERAQFCSYVEQSGATEEHLTAHQVVMLGRIPFQSIWQSAPSAEDETIVAAALAAVSMSSYGSRLYHTLSGGEQQRLQIARALAQQPRLLLLDEPTNHLDVHAQLTILTLLRQRASAGATIVLAIHDLNLAATFCDQLVLLHQGQVVSHGTPKAVLTPELLRQVYHVDASVLSHPTSGHPMVAYNRAL